MSTKARLDVSAQSKTGMGYSPFGRDSMRVMSFGKIANGEAKLENPAQYSRSGVANWIVNGQAVDPVLENGQVVFRFSGDVLESFNGVDHTRAAQWCTEHGVELLSFSQDTIPGTSIRGYWK